MKTSKHTKITSVYRNQNVLIRAVFQRAGDTRKVLCVALDYAKRKHVALICDGNGDILKAAFPVENNPAGIDFLIKEVSATARRRKIPKNQIFFGGEDEAGYVANFTAALREMVYLVVRVSAYEAKENRENLIASTDTLDLISIAKTLLARRARLNGETDCVKILRPGSAASAVEGSSYQVATQRGRGPDFHSGQAVAATTRSRLHRSAPETNIPSRSQTSPANSTPRSGTSHRAQNQPTKKNQNPS